MAPEANPNEPRCEAKTPNEGMSDENVQTSSVQHDVVLWNKGGRLLAVIRSK